MADYRCIACKESGIGADEVQSMIDTSIEGKQDTLTAGTGINITDDVIKTSDWVKIEYTDGDSWSKYVDSNITTKDVLFIMYDYGYQTGGGIRARYDLFIPKGTDVRDSLNGYITLQTGYSGRIFYMLDVYLYGTAQKPGIFYPNKNEVYGDKYCLSFRESNGVISIIHDFGSLIKPKTGAVPANAIEFYVRD